MAKEAVQKRGEEEEISILNQLIQIIDESFENLKEAYKNGDAENFNKSKVVIIQAQKIISEIVK